MLRSVLVVTVACTVLAGVLPASAQSPPTQLDRIEQKLDTILHRLDQLQPGQAGVSTPPPGSAPAASPAATPALSSAPETLAGGAVAIIHAAPATPVAAHEIPADSVGGFIYTGGPLQLADLTDRGVRYAGLVGVEWQGWLRAKEAGRYELDVDGSTVSANNLTNSTCVFAGWLEDRAIGVQEATPRSDLARPAAFSLILGAELQPGLYKLRLWATCTPTLGVRNQRISIALLEKTPSDLNLRAVTGEDLLHKQRADRVAGSSRD
jgi:hypothetical protein